MTRSRWITHSLRVLVKRATLPVRLAACVGSGIPPHRALGRAQGREYRLALDGRSMRKIKAAEAETTTSVDDIAESATTTENEPTRGGKR